MQRVHLPEPLVGTFFDQVWETPRIWALPTKANEAAIADLWWHASLPVWSTVPGQARFDLSPTAVLASPSSFPRHWDRILRADLSYPLELFQNGARWVIVDGYHRLARHHLEGNTVLPIRRHAAAHWASVSPP